MLLGICKVGLNEVKAMSASIESLNQKMAVVLERVANQDRRISILENKN
jgi:hypothetical protein